MKSNLIRTAAVALVSAALGVGLGWLLFARPRDTAQVLAPVNWRLLGATPDRRALLVLPDVSLVGCMTPVATASGDPRVALRIVVTVKNGDCDGPVDAMAFDSGPVIVAIPPVGQLVGPKIGGPGYRGVARAPATDRDRSPSVVGLRAREAVAILKANDLPIADASSSLPPSAVIVFQEPAGGIPNYRGATRPTTLIPEGP